MFSRLSKQPARAASLPVSAAAAPAASAAAAVEPSRQALELYLIAIDAKLLSLTAETRRAVLVEVRQHLEASIAAREELGIEHEAAVAEAIARFGDPARLARRFRAAYRDPASIFPGAAFRESLWCLGTSGTTLILLDAASWFRPESNPLASVSAWCWMAWFFFGPFFSGAVSGFRAPRRAALGTFYALALLALLTIPLIQWDLQRTVDIPVPLLFALWLPAGCLGAIAGSVARRVGSGRRPAAVQ